GSSVSKTFLVTTYGTHAFKCINICSEHKKKLVCGIDIECGTPPDEPRNVSCVQNGTRGRPTCTWDKGRVTYLYTAYGIQ
ncbi:I12R2 protein, partial [Paradoxornis webbianus]|nr:I12R2 protein [Sinosuthora webbiana]